MKYDDYGISFSHKDKIPMRYNAHFHGFGSVILWLIIHHIFLFILLKAWSGYMVELPWWGGFNEYIQSMFLSQIRKTIYPSKPQFYYTKWGFEGCSLHRLAKRNEKNVIFSNHRVLCLLELPHWGGLNIYPQSMF